MIMVYQISALKYKQSIDFFFPDSFEYLDKWQSDIKNFKFSWDFGGLQTQSC